MAGEKKKKQTKNNRKTNKSRDIKQLRDIMCSVGLMTKPSTLSFWLHAQKVMAVWLSGFDD